MAALIGGKARRIFLESPEVEFATTAFTMNEVRGYLPTLAIKAGEEVEELATALDGLPLTVYTQDDYGRQLDEARRRMHDPDDVHLLALAMQLNLPVWTKDRDFRGSGVKRYTTGVLLRVFDTAPPS